MFKKKNQNPKEISAFFSHIARVTVQQICILSDHAGIFSFSASLFCSQLSQLLNAGIFMSD